MGEEINTYTMYPEGGAELDALVHRFVFGHKVKTFSLHTVEGKEELDKLDEQGKEWMYGAFSEFLIEDGLPAEVSIEGDDGDMPAPLFWNEDDEGYGPYWSYVTRWDLPANALRLLKHWRESGLCCCINIKSDHHYAWDISWVYTDDTLHREHNLPYSIENFERAIAVSAIEAFRRRNPNDN